MSPAEEYALGFCSASRRTLVLKVQRSARRSRSYRGPHVPVCHCYCILNCTSNNILSNKNKKL